MICPRPGLQRKRSVAALSQGGWAGSDQPIHATQPAGCTRRPPTGCTWQTSQTDARQHHCLMPLGGGITSKNVSYTKQNHASVLLKRHLKVTQELQVRCNTGWSSTYEFSSPWSVTLTNLLVLPQWHAHTHALRPHCLVFRWHLPALPCPMWALVLKE